MSELIRKDEARAALLRKEPGAAYCIDRIKPVDAVEVVHGRWLKGTKSFRSGSIIAGYCCSECNEFNARNSNYCPNCGADMRERKDND